MSQNETLLEFPQPSVGHGSARLAERDLLTTLERLGRLADADAKVATFRYVWLHADHDVLVGLASDRAVIGQADQRLLAGSLPHFGVHVENTKALVRYLRKVDASVTLTVDGDHLVVADGKRQRARMPARTPTAADRDTLVDIGRQLTVARAACDTSELPHGATVIAVKHVTRFAGPSKRPLDAWHAPHGRVFVEVDKHFRGVIQAPRVINPRAPRPLPVGQVHPVIPERTAA